jgi:hypothetical protein
MRGTRCCEKSNARMGGWEKLKKRKELDVVKSKMQEWEDGKS